jgi:Zn-dependent protease with chaperone function
MMIIILTLSLWASIGMPPEASKAGLNLSRLSMTATVIQDKASSPERQVPRRNFWDYPINRSILFLLLERIFILVIFIIMVRQKFATRLQSWLGRYIKYEPLIYLTVLSLLAAGHFVILFTLNLLQHFEVYPIDSQSYSQLGWLKNYALSTSILHLYFIVATFFLFRLFGWLPTLIRYRTSHRSAKIVHFLVSYILTAVFFCVIGFFIIRIPSIVQNYFTAKMPLTQAHNSQRAVYLQEQLNQITNSVGVKPVTIVEVRVSDYSKALNAKGGARNEAGEGIITLHDTLFNNMSDRQILFVIAHELSHVEYGSSYTFWYPLLLILACLIFTYSLAFLLGPQHRTSCVKFYRSTFGVATMPVWGLVIAVSLLIYEPLLNRAGRIDEERADCDAIRLTVPNMIVLEDALTAVDALNVDDSSDPDPPRLLKWYGLDHPPQDERKQKIRQCASLYGLAH